MAGICVLGFSIQPISADDTTVYEPVNACADAGGTWMLKANANQPKPASDNLSEGENSNVMLTGDDDSDVIVDDLYTCVCPAGKAWDEDGMDCVAVASDEGGAKEPIKDPEPEPAPIIEEEEDKPEDDPIIEPEPEPAEMEPLAMQKTPEPETAEGGMPTGIETLNYGIMSLIASGGMLALFKRKK